MKNITAIILAAGKGKRLKSPIPKVFHSVNGKPLVSYALTLCRQLRISKIILVIGKNYHQYLQPVKPFFSKQTRVVLQHSPLGTGHAVLSAIKKTSHQEDENFLVLNGDMPLIQTSSVGQLIQKHLKNQASLSMATVVSKKFASYGRVLRNSKKEIIGIVEAKDASPAQKKIKEVNPGIYLFSSQFLKKELKKISRNNKQKEYYLTDLIGLAFQKGLMIQSIQLQKAQEALGINTPQELAKINRILKATK